MNQRELKLLKKRIKNRLKIGRFFGILFATSAIGLLFMAVQMAEKTTISLFATSVFLFGISMLVFGIVIFKVTKPIN